MPPVFSTVIWMRNYQLGHETIVSINSISIHTNKLCAMPGSVRRAKDMNACNEHDLVEFMQLFNSKVKNAVVTQVLFGML